MPDRADKSVAAAERRCRLEPLVLSDYFAPMPVGWYRLDLVQSAASPQIVRKSPVKRRRAPRLPTPPSRRIPTFSAPIAGYPDRP
jgi:hypothetical protein